MAQRLVDFGSGSHEVCTAPRMHVQTHEPVMLTETAGEPVIEGLREMGHEIDVVKGVAGAAHCAEFLKDEGKVRAGGNGWAAGVDE
jgi:gamma-glutamyltranspeptidase